MERQIGDSVLIGAVIRQILEGRDIPGTEHTHGNLVGDKEVDVADLSHGGLVGHAVLDQACVHLHSLQGILIVIAGLVLGIVDDIAAIAVDGVVITFLVGIGVAGQTVLGTIFLGQLRRDIVQSLPGPGLIGIGDARLVKHVLVVPEADRVIILGQRIGVTVILIQLHDLRIIIRQIGVLVLFDIIGQVEQDALIHILFGILRMHPEDIGHLTAGSACLQKCPVVVPVDDLDAHGDPAGRCPLVTDRLNALLLLGIPDIDHDLGHGGRLRAALLRGCLCLCRSRRALGLCLCTAAAGCSA